MKRRRNFRRRRLYRLAPWPVGFGLVIAGASLGAHRFSDVKFLPVKGFEMVPAGASVMPGSLLQASEKFSLLWKGKNRLELAWQAKRLSREVEVQYASVKEIHWDWPALLIHGQGRLKLTMRRPWARLKPEAPSRSLGTYRAPEAREARNHCLDQEGVAFVCPDGQDASIFPLVDAGLGPQAREAAAHSLALVEKVAGKIVAVESLGRLGLVFQNQAGERFEFLVQDLAGPVPMDAVFSRLEIVLYDLRERQEKFRYIDCMLAQEGRFFVGKT